MRTEMHKNPITWLAIIVGICVLLFFGYGYAHMRAMRRDWYWSIGEQLIKTTNAPQLVAVNPGLKNRLSEFLAFPAGMNRIALGDAPSPIGNGTATACLFMTNAAGGQLGIRLRRDDALGRFQSTGTFHVVGFWTP